MAIVVTGQLNEAKCSDMVSAIRSQPYRSPQPHGYSWAPCRH